MVINGYNVDIGSTISFTTINPQDSRRWYGKILGFCGYTVAAGYGDLISYYQQVLAGLANTNRVSKLADTEFMLINTETEAGTVIQAISPEWIVPESFKLEQLQQSYTIQVYTHAGETVNDVLQILRDNGFTCKALG